MPHSKSACPAPLWLPQSQLTPLPDTSTLDWLFDEGSLTRRLTRLSNDGFSVTPLFEGWQTLRADECAALDLADGSEGWVREVYLRGHGEAWVFARSVASRSALQGAGLQMKKRRIFNSGVFACKNSFYSFESLRQQILHIRSG